MTTKAFIITLKGNPESVAAAEKCQESAPPNVSAYIFDACTPEEVVARFKSYKIQWNYPWTQKVYDIASGLIKTPYRTADPKKRMACFFSHWMLWHLSFTKNESIIVLEHDALFISSKLAIETLDASPMKVISLNQPNPGATPNAEGYNTQIKRRGNGVHEPPWVRDRNMPNGLPGNSAYYLKPEGAKKLLMLTKEFGAWPNDSLMCKQLMPKELGCLFPYETTNQKTKSTTTL
jgi:GR25 family glycosyltransferase involved in LPS biosynthesis